MANLKDNFMLGRSSYSLKAGIKKSRKAHKKECNRRLRHGKIDIGGKSCVYKRNMSFAEGHSHVS